MNPKETEIIDLLFKAAEKALPYVPLNKPHYDEIKAMIEMAKRLMEGE